MEVFVPDYFYIEMRKGTYWVYLILVVAVTYTIQWAAQVVFLLTRESAIAAKHYVDNSLGMIRVAIEACPIAGLVGTFAALTSALRSDVSRGASESFIAHITGVLGVALPTTLAGMLSALLCMVIVAGVERKLGRNLGDKDV